MNAESVQRLVNLGIDYDDAEALRRISMTLHRWHELECGDGNGCIERDEKSGLPYFYHYGARYLDPHDPRSRWRIPDRETGARKRLARIMSKYPTLTAYIQGDPRGAALYILRPTDMLPGHNIDSYYNRGVAVYK